jgi:two-component system sensor histidine kinase UhpB
VAVQDDGVGFDPTTVEADTGGRHVGLTIMRERAESVGGRLEATSRPGGGTEIRAWVPARPTTTAADDDVASSVTADGKERLRGASTSAAG